MKRSHAYLLLVAAAWSVFVWVSFVVIQLHSADPSDRTLGFRAVHFTLAGISILFAVAVARVGWIHLRGRRTRLGRPLPSQDLTRTGS